MGSHLTFSLKKEKQVLMQVRRNTGKNNKVQSNVKLIEFCFQKQLDNFTPFSLSPVYVATEAHRITHIYNKYRLPSYISYNKKNIKIISSCL